MAMATARRLRWIVLLAVGLHGLALVRSDLPAQDGLTFIRIARQFQAGPWADVVRGTDRHPLYPALIALLRPIVEPLVGPGPGAWRIAAQAVSALAAIGLIFPLYTLTRSLFDPSAATLAALLVVLLPLPAEVGHETLSDAVALALTALALAAGERALRTGRAGPAVASGLAAGLGFLARPEVAIVPVALAIAAAWSRVVDRVPNLVGWAPPTFQRERRWAVPTLRHRMNSTGRIPYASPALAGALAFLGLIGGYTLVKGEVSEKLAVRIGASLASPATAARPTSNGLPSGLDDPRWDFAPKEESDAEPPSPIGPAFGRVLGRWAEGLGWGLVPFVLIGIGKGRGSKRGRRGRRLVAAYALLFGAALVRHVTTLGYLSGRHALPIVLVSLPWAAAGLLASARRLARLRNWSMAGIRWRRAVALGLMVAVGVAVQAKAAHPSRWGHRAAGLWLAEHAETADALLDTRGWASFVADRPAYDYWHVRQALSDARLAYIVVGVDELTAPSRRAATLRAVLAYAATPVAEFPSREGGDAVGVRIYRFERPESWEGLRP